MSEDFLDKIKNTPEQISFYETIEYIDKHFKFSPTAFRNGKVYNDRDQNNGSCKILGFARKLNLDKNQTLHLFGDFYREDVLKNPEGEDHQNIRNFIDYGWSGVQFEEEPLK